MGWELTNFEFEHFGEFARVFRFEARIMGDETPAELIVSGDGVILDGGKVRLNRQDSVFEQVSSVGVNPDLFVDWLATLIPGRQLDSGSAAV